MAKAKEAADRVHAQKKGAMSKGLSVSAQKKMVEEKIMGKISASGPNVMLRAFKNVNRDGDGQIQLDEFITALEKLGIDFSDEAVKVLFDSYDADGSGSINFNEFTNGVMGYSDSSGTSFMQSEGDCCLLFVS